MSADIAVFHSSEVDDPAILAEGWYIGAFRGDTLYADESCVGPYESQDRALKAMVAGAWLTGGVEFIQPNSGETKWHT